jgi:hypothetical protein
MRMNGQMYWASQSSNCPVVMLSIGCRSALALIFVGWAS